MYGESTHIAKDKDAASGETIRHEPTRIVELFMAGDVEHAKQIVRRFCMDRPCCVTVTPTVYIYRGGEEAGFVVAFRNYPRFPTDHYTIRQAAADLGEALRAELGQDSYMAVDHGGQTTWSTTRPE